MSRTYRSSHYKRISAIEASHFWFQGRNLLLSAVICRFLPRPNRELFLEIGFGTGVTLRFLEHLNFRVVGIDVNVKALAYAKKINSNARLIQRSIYTYYPDERYDVVGSFDVLEHQSRDKKFLQRCYDLLVPGGHLFLTVPAGRWLWSAIDEESDHKRRYEPEELIKKVEQSGFTVLFWNYWNVFTLPLFILWRSHVQAQGYTNVMDQYLRRPPLVMNIILFVLLRLETALMFRIHFPTGATIVLCARRRS